MATLMLLVLLWLGYIGVQVYRLQSHGRTVQAALHLEGSPLAQAPAICDHARGAADALRRLDGGTRLLHPLLPHLGWVPRVGPDLSQTPALLDTAVAAGELPLIACEAASPVLDKLRAAPQTSPTELLASAAPIISRAEPYLERADASLARVEVALARVDLGQLKKGLLGRYVPRLREVRELLPRARAAIAFGRELLPVGASVLRPGPPRRYILIAQNSAELRATGGFVGTFGTLVVEDGVPRLENFEDSYALDQRAPPELHFPVSYLRYLRISDWYGRDFNWDADFPTSVETLRYFWRLNGRPPFDGVVALDLYAVPEVIRALGPLEVEGFGRIQPENVFEQLFALYETRDKQMIGRLLQAAIARLREISPQQALDLLDAGRRLLDERHVMVVLDDVPARERLAEKHWDGALVDVPGDYLMVVESDFGLAEVGLYIDTRITYIVTLTADLRPVTATLALEIGNEYDWWKQAQTKQLVLGRCLQIERPGCYGNFVRVYMPSAVGELTTEGFGGRSEIVRNETHTMFGNYMLLVMGELQTAMLRVLPDTSVLNDGNYHLYVQKQSGTLARPLQVVIRTLDGLSLVIDTDLRVDREIVVGRRDGRLTLLRDLAPNHPSNTPANLVRRKEFVRGLERWEQGRRDEAMAIWRAGEAGNYVIDRANMLVWRQRSSEAIDVARAATELDPQSPRAAFALGYALIFAGRVEEAIAPLERSLWLDPSNTSARAALRDARSRAAGQ
ncbi:MAG: hypothetical protein RLZZ387_4657 [Chloroflexota bacterium]|jgi:tetratricopeptide (TPR) repeat protein